MKQKLKTHWNDVGASYDAYWQSLAKQYLLGRELTFISNHLARTTPETALDIGIGSGRILANHLKHGVRRVDGVDIAPAMVHACRKRFAGEKHIGRLLVCNVAIQPIPFSKPYAFITAVRVLKYNRNWRDVLKKLTRSLAPGGRIIFTMPNKHALIRFTPTETPQYYATEKELRTLVSSLGLRLVALRTFSKLPDVFYDLADTPAGLNMLLSLERTLASFLGTSLGGKIMFVAAEKPRHTSRSLRKSPADH